jgi:hypothetical protein
MVMAQIYTLVGEYELALDELEFHLSVPGHSSPAFLRADPLFTPLQELPRFLALMEKYERRETQGNE